METSQRTAMATVSRRKGAKTTKWGCSLVEVDTLTLSTSESGRKGRRRKDRVSQTGDMNDDTRIETTELEEEEEDRVSQTGDMNEGDMRESEISFAMDEGDSFLNDFPMIGSRTSTEEYEQKIEEDTSLPPMVFDHGKSTPSFTEVEKIETPSTTEESVIIFEMSSHSSVPTSTTPQVNSVWYKARPPPHHQDVQFGDYQNSEGETETSTRKLRTEYKDLDGTSYHRRSTVSPFQGGEVKHYQADWSSVSHSTFPARGSSEVSPERNDPSTHEDTTPLSEDRGNSTFIFNQEGEPPFDVEGETSSASALSRGQMAATGRGDDEAVMFRIETTTFKLWGETDSDGDITFSLG